MRSIAFAHPIQVGMSLDPSASVPHPNLNDEWAMGDDEMTLTNPETDNNGVDDTVTIDSLPPEVPSFCREERERATTCPVCTSLLLGLSVNVSHFMVYTYLVIDAIQDVEDHVNMCIDNLSTSPLSSIPAASRSEVPSSATQTPYASPLNNNTQAPSTSVGNNAFSVLMSSHKDDEAWKEAAIAEDRNSKPNKGNGGRRKAPFYKVLQGMPIAVDAFRYGSIPGVTAYFLTSVISSSYPLKLLRPYMQACTFGSLHQSRFKLEEWPHLLLACVLRFSLLPRSLLTSRAEGTANLIIHMLAVDPKWVHSLPMDIPSVIPNTNGVCVTLIEANHCKYNLGTTLKFATAHIPINRSRIMPLSL